MTTTDDCSTFSEGNAMKKRSPSFQEAARGGFLRCIACALTILAIGACGSGGAPAAIGALADGPAGGRPPPPPPPPTPADPVCPTWDEKSGVLPPLASPDLPSWPTAGAIPGSFSVTSSGTAHYAMAIELPRGRSGMQPELGIAYDSRAGYGLLGLGFSLSGLSEISYCPETERHAGPLGSATAWDHGWNADDPRCLDGVRIDGSDTRPSMHLRIVADAASGGFIVYHPDGRIARYGTSPQSLVRAGTSPRAWLLESIEDRDHNAIRYEYAKDEALDAAGEPIDVAYRPTTIRYTSHPAAPATRRIDFAYDSERFDAIKGRFAYVKGVPVSLNASRMRNIQISTGEVESGPGTPLWHYRLDYDTSPVTQRSRLTQITHGAGPRCAIGSAGCVTKPPTTFTWSGFEGAAPTATTDVAFAAGKVIGTLVLGGQPLYTFDVDRDGLEDALQFNSVKNQLVIARGGVASDFLPQQAVSKAGLKLDAGGPATIPYDWDLDGRMDLLALVPDATKTDGVSSNHLRWFRWTPTGFVDTDDPKLDTATFDVESGGARLPQVADIDGNGVPDLIVPTSQGFSAYAHTGPKTLELKFLLPNYAATAVHPGETPLVFDVNGDGADELLVRPADGGSHFVTAMLQSVDGDASNRPSVPTGLPVAAVPPPPPGFLRPEFYFPPSVFFLDVNGDGLKDVLSGDQVLPPAAPTKAPVVYINKGDFTFTDAIPLVGDAWATDFFYLAFAFVMDADGDGTQELVTSRDGATFSIARFTFPEGYRSQKIDYHFTDTTIPFALPAGIDTSGSDKGLLVARANVARPVALDGASGAFGVVAVAADGNTVASYRSNVARPDLLETVSDGLSATGGPPRVKIGYLSLVDTAATNPASPRMVYAPATECAMPVRCALGSRTIVDSYIEDGGSPKQRRIHDVSYFDGREDLSGGGDLGFSGIVDKVRDGGASHRFVSTRFERAFEASADGHDFPFVGRPTEVFSQEGQTPTQTTERRRSTLDVQGTPGASYFVYERVVETKSADAGGPISDGTTTTTVDGYGNVTLLAAQVGAGPVFERETTVARVFAPDTAAWLLRLLETETTAAIQRSPDGAVADTAHRAVAMTYAPAGAADRSAHPTSATVAPDVTDATQRLTATYARDVFGNTTYLTLTDLNGSQRKSCVSYEPSGISPFASVNALGHVEYDGYDPATGAHVAHVDPNGAVSRIAYDSFARVTRALNPDGTWVAVDRRTASSLVGPAIVTRTSSDGAEETTATDSTGKALERTSWVIGNGTAGRQVTTDFAYDAWGERLTRRSVPHFLPAPSPLPHDTYQYDSAGRPILSNLVDAATTQMVYAGEASKITVGTSPTTYVRDHSGRVVRVVDALGSATTYAYAAFGELREVLDAHGNVTLRTHYDDYGRALSVESEDGGTRTFTYDAFGQKLSETSPSGEYVSYEYDAIGRPTRRVAPEGTTRWVWDLAPNGVGKLAYMQSPSGNREWHEYDAFGRLTTTGVVISGETYMTINSYNALGQLQRLTYPSVGNEPFAVDFTYDAHGQLIETRDANTGVAYWKATTADARGNVDDESFGNHVRSAKVFTADGRPTWIVTQNQLTRDFIQQLRYVYDGNDNLRSRWDFLQAAGEESFHYDALNRLRTVTDASKAVKYSYDFDDLGNITNKSDVGAYQYLGPRPHAVTQTVSPGGLDAYTYDLNGNQSSRPGYPSLSYTSFGKLSGITATSPAKSGAIDYDALDRRVVKKLGPETTHYVGGVYEKTVRATGTAAHRVMAEEHRYYVPGGGRVVAVVHKSLGPVFNATSTYYVHTDHAGSTDVLTNAGGAVAERRSYDPYGAPRKAAWNQSGPPGKPLDPIGYTGATDDTELGLVDLSARSYDPRLGRFLQTDPVIAAPFSSQDLNPYSYVANNPVSRRDRTGLAGECLGLETICGADPPPLVQGGGSPGGGDGGGQSGGAAGSAPTASTNAPWVRPLPPPLRTAPPPTSLIVGGAAPSGPTWSGVTPPTGRSGITPGTSGEWDLVDVVFDRNSDKLIAGVATVATGVILGLAAGPLVFGGAALAAAGESGLLAGVGAAVRSVVGPAASGLVGIFRSPPARDRIVAAIDAEAPALESSAAGALRSVGPRVWQSSEGLLYAGDPKFGNRVQHVLSHTVDIPTRAGPHGVFDVGRSNVIALVDQAWRLAQAGGPGVSMANQGARVVYTIDMGRGIGFVGGMEGATLGNPAAWHLRLVLQGSNVITAFPISPLLERD